MNIISSLHTGVSIGFNSTSYTVREDDGFVSVCFRFLGPLKNNSFVELNITIISANPDGECAHTCTHTNTTHTFGNNSKGSHSH